MRTLHLTLKKKWFDMILAKEKPEEYREIKPYWVKRLENKHYDVVEFRNGYSKDAPKMIVECKGITIAKGRPRWGADFGVSYFVISLGEILITENINF